VGEPVDGRLPEEDPDPELEPEEEPEELLPEEVEKEGGLPGEREGVEEEEEEKEKEEGPRRPATSGRGAGSRLGIMAVEKPEMRTVWPTAGPRPKSCFLTSGPRTITRRRSASSNSSRKRPSSRGRFRILVISGVTPEM